MTSPALYIKAIISSTTLAISGELTDFDNNFNNMTLPEKHHFDYQLLWNPIHTRSHVSI
jgi:hypothetical protein